MKYVNKMKDILSQKAGTGIKDSVFQIGQFNKLGCEGGGNRSQSLLRKDDRKTKEKQNRYTGNHCMSTDKMQRSYY